ncbi:MAG: nucleotidyltransferase [Deltaproteobacteria bacterium]|nr:MAG: nucleotidyltransferase [Deltaproteobacteria bacterium]
MDPAIELDFTPLEKAIESLRRALAQPKNEFIRDSVIQRFEFCYELGWKFLRRCLAEEEGAEYVRHLSRKDIFRLAAQKGIIDAPEQWFDFHRARNETSHLDSENKADEVYEKAREFLPAVEKLLAQLEKRCND